MKTIAYTLAFLGALPFAYAQSNVAGTTPQAEDVARISEAQEAGVRAALDGKHVAEQLDQASIRTMELARSKALAELEDQDGGPLTAHKLTLDAFDAGGRGATPPLVVRTSDMEPKALSNIQEDLTVMSRILNKTLEREIGKDGQDSAMGIVISTLPGTRRPQSIYLEGYGALPPERSVSFSAASRERSGKGRQKRRYYLGTDEARNLCHSGQGRDGADLGSGDGGPHEAVEYDAEQVEALRKGLIDTLKNASNIRDVKPDESITIAVFGTRGGGAQVNRVKRAYRSGGAAKADVIRTVDSAGNRESNLTIRAKKSDIDAFAKGDLDAEEFRKRVSVAVY